MFRGVVKHSWSDPKHADKSEFGKCCKISVSPSARRFVSSLIQAIRRVSIPLSVLVLGVMGLVRSLWNFTGTGGVLTSWCQHKFNSAVT